ncbi:hypothetical protein N7486_004670 [Penicillium sp. IBT 16267x]|nr:hypothetical protein N7486_004670 [Penicillium sp. IBT 16267x]
MNPNPQFPNAPGGGGMVGVKPGMQQPNKDSQQSQSIIMGHVAQVLHAQGPFSGWKAEVHIKIRAMNVWQMITSLRLIQPRIDIQAAAQAALSFEQKAFLKANERVDYERECNEKLSHIKDTRQRQAAVALQSGMQSGMIPQAGMQNPLQAGFSQQMNRGMQASPIPGQQQMPMGMSDPNQQAAMQQRQQQQSAMLQQQQRAQQRPTNSGPLHDDLNTLSPQDVEHVSRLANQMLAKTSAEDMEKIKMNLSNMSAEQRTYLARKNMDPMTYFFRSQALNQLRRHRRARMEMGRPNNAGMDSNGAMMGDPMMNQRHLLQNMMNLQRNSGFSGSPGQGLDSNSFIGNVENIQGQQADGLRSQEAGQLVVPASSSQMNQQPFPNQQQQNMFPQQMGQNGQNMNPQLFGQQHFPNGSNGPQDRMQFQAQQSQAQAQAQARAQAAAAQKAQLALSGHGGQANPQMAQSSPVMPMLNQPMAPGQMSPVQVPGQPRPPSRPPNAGQPNMQGRPQIPANLPQAVQEQLAQMTNEQLQAFFLTQRRNAMANNMARNGGQQPGPLQQTGSQAGQGQAMFNAQMAGNSRMRNSMGMPQGMNPAGSAPPQQIPGQALTPQQRVQQQQRQQDLYKLQLLHQQNNGLEMTPDQVKEMDRAAFPPTIINNQNHNPSQVPKHIKTWGQLKQWANTNPQASNGVDLTKLMTLQKLHFGQILANRAGASNNQGQGILSQHPQGQPGQMPNVQNLPNGQPQPNMPQMRPLTPQDIHMARQKMGQNSNNLSDDQIRELLQHRQRQIILQAARARQEMNVNAAKMAPGQHNQPMPQPPVSVPQTAAQVNPPTGPQPPATTDQQQSNTKPQAGGSAKNAKAAAGKQNQKSKVKMEDVGEAQASATPQQPYQVAAAAAAPPATRPGVPFSHEQLHSMTPQQRMQVESHMRKQQQNFLRGPIITRAAADENWKNNLKPEIMSVYMDIAKSAPPTQPIANTPEQKAVMSQLLMDSLDILGRLDFLMSHGFAKMQGQEKNVRNLLAMRVQIMRQFKNNTQDWVLNDHFTISHDYLTGAILFIRKLFQLMFLRMNQQRSNATAPVSAAQAPSTTALNATNLQQLQAQQEEALQHARRASSQSGVAVAPAPFGAPSPQGVPHAYGPGGLAPEKLKLPPPKKRKQSHAGAASASPVQPNSASVAAATYQAAVANAKTKAAALAGAFKCSVVECQHHFQGLPTQAALDKHVEENHQPEEEENIGDPMQFYLDSVSIGLGLTADGQQPKQSIESAPAANTSNKLSAMASPAKQGLPTPITASTTPMARVTSQLGAKTASPATSAQQLTPLQAANKSGKRSPGKQPGKRTLDDLEAEDPWADAPMNLEKIHDTFAPILADCRRKGLGYDPFDEFLNTDMFSLEQSDDTPDSRDTALATLTPKDDHKDCNGVVWYDFMPWDEESIQATQDWMQLPPSSEFSNGVRFPTGSDALKFDWNNDEQPQKDMNLENGTIAIAAL